MYKLHLIFKYLLKRRIAWVSLAAVTLCTTMVLVVISVMGGWLDMFENSFHGLSGDVLVRSDSLAGFPYYQDMIRHIEALPTIEAAVPTIQTYGLINIGNITTEGVQVMGFPIDQIGKVNRFPDSLYLQHQAIEARLKDPKAALPPAERERLERELQVPPSFDLLDESFAFRDKLPADVQIDAKTGAVQKVPEELDGKLRFDALRRRLVFKGVMSKEDAAALAGLSSDEGFRRDVASLYEQSHRTGMVHYKAILPHSKADVTKWPGMIPGAGVVGIHRNEKGEVEGRDALLYRIPVKLTVLGITGGDIDVQNKAEKVYWIVDDSRTQIWQYDNKMVYVPFNVLQTDLGMDQRTATDEVTGEKVTVPARATEIDVRVKPGADLRAVRKQVEQAVHEALVEKRGGDFLASSEPRVETWRESQAIWIDAIEHEKLLTVFLFGIISLVAIFLIFCIFYMIVVEKTRDIGIIKSVGATGEGVAGIFLGYGATIGIVGSLLGLLASYLIVHNINELHAELGRRLHVQIWNPEVYLFDKIPNTMDPAEVIKILSIAIVAAILGALIPAIRAARLNPVEALRWE